MTDCLYDLYFVCSVLSVRPIKKDEEKKAKIIFTLSMTLGLMNFFFDHKYIMFDTKLQPLP